MSGTATFDSVGNSYETRQSHRPTIGSTIQEAHPRAEAFMSTAVMCQAITPVEQGFAGLISSVDWRVQPVTLDLLDANPTALVGVVGSSVQENQFVWMVVKGVWEFRVVDGTNAGVILSASLTKPGVLAQPFTEGDMSAGGVTILNISPIEARTGGDGLVLGKLDYPTIDY